MKSKKASARSGKKLVRILFVVTLVLLAASVLIMRFPPRIGDGAWHDESRIVMIAQGIVYGALFALVGLIATEGLSGSDALLVPAPLLAGLLPVLLAVFGLIYGLRAEPGRYLVLDGSVYTLEDGKVCLENAGKGPGADFEVPAEVTGYPLTYIGNGCFRGTAYESVTVPGSVTGVGKNAFAGSSVRTVVFGEGGALSLMSGVFRRCGSLQTVSFLRKSVRLEKNAFRGDAALETVWFDGDCLINGDGVFLGCTGLRSLVCRASVDLGENVSASPLIRCPDAVLYCDHVRGSALRQNARIEPFGAYAALTGAEVPGVTAVTARIDDGMYHGGADSYLLIENHDEGLVLVSFGIGAGFSCDRAPGSYAGGGVLRFAGTDLGGGDVSGEIRAGDGSLVLTILDWDHDDLLPDGSELSFSR